MCCRGAMTAQPRPGMVARNAPITTGGKQPATAPGSTPAGAGITTDPTAPRSAGARTYTPFHIIDQAGPDDIRRAAS